MFVNSDIFGSVLKKTENRNLSCERRSIPGMSYIYFHVTTHLIPFLNRGKL